MDRYADMQGFLYSKAAARYFAELYGAREGTLIGQIMRYGKLYKGFVERFGEREPMYAYSAPGRAEISGNHTDHQGGRVLAAAITLDELAMVAANDTGIITLAIEGDRANIVVDTRGQQPIEAENGTPEGLVRGVVARLNEMGYAVGGFDAAVSSYIPWGTGLSSSAAIEVLICSIISGLYNEDSIPPLERALAAQYAENRFFGKPCGLMDPLTSARGGLISIDFRGGAPNVRTVKADFALLRYAIVIVDTGSNHAGLNQAYADVPRDMQSVAQVFSAHWLSQISLEQVEDNIPMLRKRVSDRAILRALHYFREDARVPKQVAALERGDIDAFFALVIESGVSSWQLLQNVVVPGREEQGVALALSLSSRFLKGSGAWRVHGGGFAGSIQCFVPSEMALAFCAYMDGVFGDGACKVVDVRVCGATGMKLPIGNGGQRGGV